MPERVITGFRNSPERALTRLVSYELADRYTANGEVFDARTRNFAGHVLWWEKVFVAEGAKTKELFFCRPGTFLRAAEPYKNGLILGTRRTLTRKSNGIVVGPDLPPVTVGEHWEPIGESVSMLLVRTGSQCAPVGDSTPDNLRETPIDRTFEHVDLIVGSGHPGKGAWEVSTELLKQSVTDLLATASEEIARPPLH